MLRNSKAVFLAMLMALSVFSIAGAESGYQNIGSGSSSDSLVHPSGIALYKNSLFVCDSMQSKVLIYDIRSKKLQANYFSYNNGAEKFVSPQGISIDEQGFIYISHRDNVIKLNEHFELLAEFKLSALFIDIVYHNSLLWVCNFSDNEVIALNADDLSISHRFPTGEGPASLAFNSAGELLVSETGENRISFYTEKGARIRNPLILGKNSIIDGIAIGPNDWIFLHDSFYYQIHAYSRGGGSKLRELNIPGNTVRCWKPGNNGMIVSNDLIYFSSIVSHEVMVITDMGQTRESYGQKPQANELVYPRSMILVEDQIHVTDTYAGNVKRYSLQGQYLGNYGSQPGRGRMDFPTGIAVNSEKQVFILNAHASVLVYDSSGQYQKEITVQSPLSCASDIALDAKTIYIADTGNQRVLLCDHNGKIIEEYSSFVQPAFLHLSPKTKQLFVADPGDASVKLIDQGRLIQTIRHSTMKKPVGLTSVGDNILAVVDNEKHQIHIFFKAKDQYAYVRSFGEYGGPNLSNDDESMKNIEARGFFAYPQGIAFDGNFFYIVDSMNHRIQRIAKGLLIDGIGGSEDNDIHIEPTSLDFGRINAGEKPRLSLWLKKTGSEDISGTLSSTQNWIVLSKTTFQGDSQIIVSIDSTTLSKGERLGEIVVNSNFRRLVVPVTVFIEDDSSIKPEPPVESKTIQIVLQINHPKAIIDGVEQWIDPGNPAVVPVILPPGRTFVPIRFISEAFGAEVQWESSTRSVRIFLEAKDVRITLQIDNKIARVNQDIVSLDAPPQILNGRTFVPLRFIAEAFTAQVDWDGKEQKILISLEI